MTENVRAALTRRPRRSGISAIVYETDAKSSRKREDDRRFPPDSHPPIVYPVALTTNAEPAEAFSLSVLRSQAAKAVFEALRLHVLIRPTS